MKKFIAFLLILTMVLVLGSTIAYALGTLSPSSLSFTGSGGTRTITCSSTASPIPILKSNASWCKVSAGPFLSWIVTCDPNNTSSSRSTTISVTYGSPTIKVTQAVKTYMVSYSANGGTGAPPAMQKTHNKALLLSSVEPTRAGYTFLGWSTSSTANTPTYWVGEQNYYTTNASDWLYAVWGYSVTYVANGGTDAPAKQYKSIGTNITLSSAKPTKTGYTFLGWSTGTADTIIDYDPGDTYSTDANVVLYAIWGHTVTYYANDGTDALDRQYKPTGTDITLRSAKWTRSGQNFLGWSTDSAASAPNHKYDPGDTYADNADLALYAVWGYTITYEANKGTGAPDPQYKQYGVGITLSPTAPTREGYYFEGWSTIKDGPVAFQPGFYYSSNYDLDLYAVWQIKTYTITYNPNEGTGGPTDQIKMFGETVTLRSTTPTKTGYDFLGWSKGSTATDPDHDFDPGDLYSDNADLALYAVWQIKTYTITYNANGEAVRNLPTNQKKIYGTDTFLSTTIPIRDGYDFQGWSSYIGGPVILQPGFLYTSNGNLDLYAVWHPCLITYDANGGTGAPPPEINTFGENQPLSTKEPTRWGYAFSGWSSDQNAKVSDFHYHPGDNYAGDLCVTLYAIWDPIPVTSSSIDKTLISLDIYDDDTTNDNATIVCTYAPANACPPTFTSSDPTVATVSESVLNIGESETTATVTITALKGGEVKVAVKPANTIGWECTVRVWKKHTPTPTDLDPIYFQDAGHPLDNDEAAKLKCPGAEYCGDPVGHLTESCGDYTGWAKKYIEKFYIHNNSNDTSDLSDILGPDEIAILDQYLQRDYYEIHKQAEGNWKFLFYRLAQPIEPIDFTNDQYDALKKFILDDPAEDPAVIEQLWLDENYKFYRMLKYIIPENYFSGKSFEQFQQDPDVYRFAQLIQPKVDEDGNLVLNKYGDPIPIGLGTTFYVRLVVGVDHPPILSNHAIGLAADVNSNIKEDLYNADGNLIGSKQVNKKNDDYNHIYDQYKWNRLHKNYILWINCFQPAGYKWGADFYSSSASDAMHFQVKTLNDFETLLSNYPG